MNKTLKYIVTALITIVGLFLVWYFSNIVAYILVSAVLAIIGKPLVDMLSGLHIGKRKFPVWLAALTSLAAIWLLVIGLFSLFVPTLFHQINELSSLNISNVIESFQKPIQTAQEFIGHIFSVDEADFSISGAIAQEFNSLLDINKINGVLTSVVSAVGSVVVAAFSISFITFFFLKESTLFRDMVILIFPPKHEESIKRALNSTTNLLVRYFTGIIAESAIVVVIASCGLLIFGFPWGVALTIAMFAGLLNVIPYLGPIITMALGLFLGVVNGLEGVSTLGVTLRIAGVLLFTQGVDNFILQPVLYSSTAKAHPLEIFIVILLAGSIAGVLGMLLAIPSYNVIRVFAKEFFNHLRVVQKLTQKI